MWGGSGTPLQALRGAVADRTPDGVLDSIAGDAVTQTGASWAAITIRLDRVIAFRGHANLPIQLASLKMIPSRGSFCERVIESGVPLEISDVSLDPRSTDLRRFVGVVAYQGLPLQIEGVNVGTLCVHDSRPRTFERSAMESLARAANRRLEHLSVKHRERLVELAMRPALARLRNSVTPLQSDVMLASDLLADLEVTRAEAWLMRHRTRDQLDAIMQRFRKVMLEVRQQLRALRMLSLDGEHAAVSEITYAAEMLAHHHTAMVGGLRWVGVGSQRDVVVNAQTSIALVSTSLSLVAQSLHAARRATGIEIHVVESQDAVRFELRSGISNGPLQECRAAITTLIEGEEAAVDCANGVLVISLRAA